MADNDTTVKATEGTIAKTAEETNKFQKAFESAQKTTEKVEQKMQTFNKKISGVSSAFKKLASTGVQYNASLENYEVSFERMTGSAQKAADTVDQLKQMAAATPLEMSGLANTTQLLVNYGFTVDEAMGQMQMLGDLAQGSSDKLSTIATAYGKMSSTGKVSLDTITQMINAGFNPLQEISQTTGESMDSLYARISAGSLSVDEITASMQRSTSEGGQFFQSMEKQSQTFSGQLATLKENTQMLTGSLTEGLFDKLAQDILPKINEVVSSVNEGFEQGGFQGAVDAVKEFSPVLGTVLSAVEPLVSKLSEIGIDPGVLIGAAAAAAPLVAALTKVTSVGGSLFGVMGKISGIFSLLPTPVSIVIAAIAGLVAIFAYFMATNEDFRNSLIPVWESISLMISQLVSALMPVITSIVVALMNLIQALMPSLVAIMNVIMATIQAIMPVITDILSIVISVVSSILVALAPIISYVGLVISSIMLVISPLITYIADCIAVVIRVIGTVLSAITGTLATIFSVVTSVTTQVYTVVSNIINVISTIIAGITNVVGNVFNSIYSIVSSIMTSVGNFFAGIFNGIKGAWNTLTSVVSGVFNTIYSIVSSIMKNVGNFINGIFDGIKGAWNGLTSFVQGIFNGIGDAVGVLVDSVKGFINGVIGGINSAIGLINMIPGVEIGLIPYLLHGTEDWQGGFARMNEGGRGELTYLPNGAQVIPHDISVKYAKEAARANVQQAEPALFMIDYDRLAAAMTNVRLTPVVALDGEKVSRGLGPYTDAEMGYRARQTARGMI